jgi:hypothetical protein
MVEWKGGAMLKSLPETTIPTTETVKETETKRNDI